MIMIDFAYRTVAPQRTDISSGKFGFRNNEVVRLDIVQGANIWMIERGNLMRFALKPFGELDPALSAEVRQVEGLLRSERDGGVDPHGVYNGR